MATLRELADQYTVAIVKMDRLIAEETKAEKNLRLLRREVGQARTLVAELGDQVLWVASGECER